MSSDRMPSVSSEAEDLRTVNTILLETFTHCNELKSDLVEFSPNLRQDLKDFKEKVADLAEMQKDVSALIETLETIEAKMEDEDSTNLDYEKISSIFNSAYVSALEEEYTNEKVENMIAAVDSYINNPNSGANVGNEELLVTATKESYLDPLSKLPIQDPVKSKTCHHTFERNTILKHIQKYSRCPYSGCVNDLSREDLIEDLALKRKLLNMKQNPSK